MDWLPFENAAGAGSVGRCRHDVKLLRVSSGVASKNKLFSCRDFAFRAACAEKEGREAKRNGEKGVSVLIVDWRSGLSHARECSSPLAGKITRPARSRGARTIRQQLPRLYDEQMIGRGGRIPGRRRLSFKFRI